MLLTARHAERPHLVRDLADSGLIAGCAVRACMPLLRRLRPATCPVGPGGREASNWQTPVAQDRVCMCLESALT